MRTIDMPATSKSTASAALPDVDVPERDIELSIVMPCLNEAETVGICVRKAGRFLETSATCGEIVIADNGSTDDSRAVAAAEGARIVLVERRGYGAALLGGIAAAKGRFVIMGDADDSYDFSNLMPFLDKLRAGADLVMGNRFQGKIEAGAMPFLHRYLGNPVLSFLGRLFFGVKTGDFHCGLRGFDRQRILDLNLRTTGMEFATEMIVRSALAGYTIAEVPTVLRPDGRSRPPHLRTWRDGWRHLRFLLMYSPRWLFLYPGIALLVFGVIGSSLLLPGPFFIGQVGIDIHTFIVACMCILLGTQSICFAVVARRYGMKAGFVPVSTAYPTGFEALSLERLLLVALGLCLLGAAGIVWCIAVWASAGFGPLQYAALLRFLVLSLTAVAVAVQLALTAFLVGIMEIPTQDKVKRDDP
jgi:glycosyltransferase involved in cell wall biosynthesis